MLKRGMTQQERIDNGYWVAYPIALAMEQWLAAQRPHCQQNHSNQ
jgi:hypothetical protein